MDLITAQGEHHHEHGHIDLVVDVQIAAEPQVMAVEAPQEEHGAGSGAAGECMCDTDAHEHEEGEISDDNDEALENHERAEESKSPNGKDDQNKASLQDHPTPGGLKPSVNSYSKWSGRLDSDGRQFGWGWGSVASSFSRQPGQFYQMAWLKGVQGSPKESQGDSPLEDVGSRMAESFPGDFKGQECVTKCYQPFGESPVRTYDTDTGTGEGAFLHRSTSWSANGDVEYSMGQKAGWLDGHRGINFLKNDNAYWDEGGGRFEQQGFLTVENWKGRSDKPDRGTAERSITLRSRVEKVDREVYELGERDEEERNLPRNLQESSPSLHEEHRPFRSRRFQKDGRGGGELEDGEIESGLWQRKGALNKLNALRSVQDKPVANSKFRERQVGKSFERSHSLSYLKDRRHHDFSNQCHTSLDYDKDMLLAECTDLVRNVAVKDAQRSFIGVCKQLRRALKFLRDFYKQSAREDEQAQVQRWRVYDLVQQTFSGIRAAYAVRNTAIGKEQEQDTDVFPRLLDLAYGSCQNIFTSKQIRELKSMMQTIGHYSKVEHTQQVYSNTLPQGNTESHEGKSLKIGESSANASFTAQFENESTSDSPANGMTLHLRGETDQAADTSTGLQLEGGMPLASAGISGDETRASDIGYGGWFSVNPEQGQPRAFSSSMGMEPVLHQTPASYPDFVGSKSKQIHRAGFDMESKSGLVVESYMQEASSRNNSWPLPLDPVSAVASYHEKFAGKSRMVQTRLPSPTPSDEDEDVTANNRSETSASVVNVDLTEAQSGGKEVQRIGGQVVESNNTTLSSSSFQDSGNAHQGAISTVGRVHSRSVPLELRLFSEPESVVIESGDLEGPKAKASSAPGRVLKKSRDPRRILGNDYFDSELSQTDATDRRDFEKEKTLPRPSSRAHGVENDALGTTAGPTLQNVQTSSNETLVPKGEILSSLTVATGGWLQEQPILDVPVDMDIVNEGLSKNLDPTSIPLDRLPKRERELDYLSKDTSSKRQKLVAVLKDGADGSHAEGLRDQIDIAAVPGGHSNLGDMGEKVPQLTGIGSIRPNTVSESTAASSMKPRMKSRDPRRVFLSGALEKNANSDSVAATLKGVTLAAKISTPRISTLGKAKDAAHSQESSSPSLDRDDQISSANMEGNGSRGILPARSVSSPPSEGNSSPSGDVDLCDSSKSGRPEGSIMASKVTESALANCSVAKPSSKSDSNVGAGAPKQPEGKNHWNRLELLLEGLDEKQKQAVRQERARRIEEQSRMFNARKLCLVLDLDHTLLNSAKFTEIEEEWEARLRANEAMECNKVSKEGVGKRELYRFSHMGMWTKLRPGIWNFLARASQLFELHVYTMGNKAYAREMAKVLDPTGNLFLGRVISKGDDGDGIDGDERPPKSKDLDGVLGMESAVVIIDDSARVWPHHRHNLIVVERYMYFPCSRKQFGLSGPSLLEVGHDERELDGMLASALRVIEKIHYSFFSNPRLHEVDVRDILAAEQRRVLAGCKIIFSRVFPQGESQPQLHPIWQMAEQFGAVCTGAVHDEVTHVVAISLGTDKVNWALANGKFVVRPTWLEASAILYRRANEQDFPVPP